MAITQQLKVGSRGKQVEELQRKIGVKVDGIFGPKTQAAVRAYQSRQNIAADGIVGPITRGKLSGGSNSDRKPSRNRTPEPSRNTVVVNGQSYQTQNEEDANFMNNAIVPYLNQLQNQGLAVKPDMDLTADVIAQILDKAKETVAPEYAQQIDALKEDTLRNANLTIDDYNSRIASTEASFGRNLENSRERNAGSGTTFSGVRGAQEQDALAEQNRNLSSLSSAAGNSLGDYSRNLEKNLGTDGAAGFNLPSLNNYSASLAGKGGFAQSGQADTNYTPGTYQLGSIPQAQEAAGLALRNQNVQEASKRKAKGISYSDLYN